MFWDDLVRRWRKDARTNSPRLLRAAGGHVAVFPAPRQEHPVRLLMAAIAILALLVLLLVGSGRVSLVTDSPRPQPAASAQPPR